MKTYSWVPISILALAVACGGTERSSTAGATVEGALHIAGASPAGVQVSVASTSLSTSSDETGHFLLERVPAGSVRLRFRGPGVDAQLDLGVLVDGMKVVIDVHVSGSRSEGRVEVEFSGTIESKIPPDKDSCPKSAVGCLKVAGKTVIVTAATEIEREDEGEHERGHEGKHEEKTLTFADLKKGDFVRVEGRLQSDGSVLAREIEVLPAPPKREVQLEGIIQEIDAAKLTLKVSGTKVVTDSATRIRRGDDVITFKDLKVGDRVHVKGTLQADGSVLASRIRVAPGFVPRVVLDGIIESITPPDKLPSRLKVSGLTVIVTAATEIEREGKHEERKLTIADLKVGDQVRVRGTPQPDGTILAQEIRVQVGERRHD